MERISFVRIGGACVILGGISFFVATAIHNIDDLPGYRWLPDDPGQWLLDVDRQTQPSRLKRGSRYSAWC